MNFVIKAFKNVKPTCHQEQVVINERALYNC